MTPWQRTLIRALMVIACLMDVWNLTNIPVLWGRWWLSLGCLAVTGVSWVGVEVVWVRVRWELYRAGWDRARSELNRFHDQGDG